MKISLIYNGAAGADEPLVAEDISSAIGKAGHDLLYVAVRHSDWPEAMSRDIDVLAVAGGDGTVGTAAKELVGKSVAIAVLPIGTANNIANTLGIIDRPIEELIAEWASASHMAFDVGRATGP